LARGRATLRRLMDLEEKAIPTRKAREGLPGSLAA
jgi:hypothetical protein